MYQTMLGLLLASVVQVPVTQVNVSPSVEQAARDYRITVYNTLRTNRPEYDRLRNAGDTLLANWRMGGQPADQRQEVVAWFESVGNRTTLATADRPLPVQPEFPVAQKVTLTDPDHSNAPSSEESDEGAEVEVIDLDSEGSGLTVQPPLPKLERMTVEEPKMKNNPFSTSHDPADFLKQPTPLGEKSSVAKNKNDTGFFKWIGNGVKRAAALSADSEVEETQDLD